jgi:DNA repair exonuclease SbcCD ATPase subunit
MDEYDFIPFTYNFINRLHNSHIYISELANTMMYNNSFSLADNLSNAIDNYQITCTPETIRNLRYWINQAYSHGIIKIGNEVLSKLQEKEQRVMELENEIELQEEEYEKQMKDLIEKHDELSTQYVHLQGKYDELEEKFGKILPKDKGDDLFRE